MFKGLLTIILVILLSISCSSEVKNSTLTSNTIKKREKLFTKINTSKTIKKSKKKIVTNLIKKERKVDNDFIKSLEMSMTIIKNDDSPIIEVKLKNVGKSSVNILWDKNFGKLLWSKKFVLVNEDMENTSSIPSFTKSSINKKNTLGLRMKTSNTYEATKEVDLEKGGLLKSTIDFSKLPISKESGLISKKTTLRVYYRYLEDGKEIFTPISEKLVLRK